MAEALSPEAIAAPDASGTEAFAMTTVFVCTTCHGKGGNPGLRAGGQLFDALAARSRDPRVRVEPVACLSVCKPSCAMSFAAEGKWTYVYAVPSDTDVATILEGARLYGETTDGLIPWSQRPDVLKRGVVARVPPLARAR